MNFVKRVLSSVKACSELYGSYERINGILTMITEVKKLLTAIVKNPILIFLRGMIIKLLSWLQVAFCNAIKSRLQIVAFGHFKEKFNFIAIWFFEDNQNSKMQKFLKIVLQDTIMKSSAIIEISVLSSWKT